MKYTKRLIVMLLALVLLSLNITGFAYYTGDTVESTLPAKYETAVKTLFGLGVLPSMKVENYDNTITREEFSTYVRNFGGKAITVPIPAEDDITMGEAVKLIIQMTDNVTLAEYYGPYPTGYFSVASSMGITYGLTGVQEYDKLTYGMAIQMLYNTLSVTPSVVNSVTSGGKVKYEYDSSRTVLTEYLDVTLKQGFVSADGFWSVNPEQLPGDDGVVISGRHYRLKSPGVDDYVGFVVNYYYHAEDDLILAIEKTNKANQVILRGNNIKRFNSNVYTYEVDGKETEYVLDDNVYVVSNYLAELNSVDMWPSNGDIILVDSDGNKRYETVLIKRYEEVEVQIFDTEREQFVTKAGKIYNVPKELPVRVYSDGVLVDSTHVKSGTYASIVVDNNNNVREIYLSTTKIKGTVVSYSYDVRKSVVTVDGVEYVVSNAMENRTNITVGTTGTFVINFKDEISNFTMGSVDSSGSATTTYLGYLIKMRKVMTDVGDAYVAKILTEKGTIESLELIEKVKLNKARVDVDIRGLLGATVNTITNEYNDDVKRQVIQYAVNTDNKITKIDTALPYDTLNDTISSEVKYGDYKLHESLVGNVKYGTNSFDQQLIYSSTDTILFCVPADETNEDDYNFKVGVGLKNTASNNIVAYNFEPNAAVADVVVVKQARAIGVAGMCGGAGDEVDINNDPLMMVTKVTHEYHEDYGIGFDMIEYVNIKTGAVAKKLLADNARWSTTGGDVESFTPGKGSKDLKPGDLFHMSENGLGEIGTVMKHYDASDDCLVEGTRTDGGAFHGNAIIGSDVPSFYSSGKFYEGYPVSASEKSLVTSNLATDIFATAKRKNLKYYQKHDTHTRVYKIRVNGNTSEYEKITLEAISPSVNGNSKAVIYTSWAQLISVIVYEQ